MTHTDVSASLNFPIREEEYVDLQHPRLPVVVSRRLGHADVQTTIDLYGWVTEDAEMRAAAEWRRFAEGWRTSGD